MLDCDQHRTPPRKIRTYVDMWLLAVSSGTPAGLSLTTLSRPSLLITLLLLRPCTHRPAREPTTPKTNLLGIPPCCHLLIAALAASVALLCNALSARGPRVCWSKVRMRIRKTNFPLRQLSRRFPLKAKLLFGNSGQTYKKLRCFADCIRVRLPSVTLLGSLTALEAKSAGVAEEWRGSVERRRFALKPRVIQNRFCNCDVAVNC